VLLGTSAQKEGADLAGMKQTMGSKETLKQKKMLQA
jgi:hypothetical protein